MNEIYWITRLDMINGWLIAFSVISGFVMMVAIGTILISYIILTSQSSYNSEKEEAKSAIRTFKPLRKYSLIVFCITLLLSILTPTKEEGMLIWGVGSTIDYIKENETIKQLPDKVVNALDAWVESLSDDKEE
jgi:hypothetical protein